MFLDAVILILQEILEAALLLSVLLVVSRQLGLRNNRQSDFPWYAAAVGSGIVGAALFAWAMPMVSEWFDSVGQEVSTAFMQFIVIASLYAHCLLQTQQPASRFGNTALGLTLVVVVALAITREGCEIFLYLNGIRGTPSAVMPALLGTGVAGGIGISAGILLYYLLAGFSSRIALRTAMVLLALFAGNMAAQAVLLLTQADWLPFTPQLWDSSPLLTEYSVSGQLLYALVGYEATPSLAQGLAYLAGVALLASTPLFRRSWLESESKA